MLIEIGVSSLEEFGSCIVQSEQLWPIEIVLMKINQIVSVGRQKYFENTAREQHNCFLIKKRQVIFFKSPSNIKLRSKIITIFAYEDVNACFSHSLGYLCFSLSTYAF